MLEPVDDDRRRRAILAEMARLGPTLPGSISERMTRCNTEGCRCNAEPPRLHGPYITWSHRQGGRQVNQTISVDRAARLRPLIEADRKLHQLVRELEVLALSGIDDVFG